MHAVYLPAEASAGLAHRCLEEKDAPIHSFSRENLVGVGPGVAVSKACRIGGTHFKKKDKIVHVKLDKRTFIPDKKSQQFLET